MQTQQILGQATHVASMIVSRIPVETLKAEQRRVFKRVDYVELEASEGFGRRADGLNEFEDPVAGPFGKDCVGQEKESEAGGHDV